MIFIIMIAVSEADLFSSGLIGWVTFRACLADKEKTHLWPQSSSYFMPDITASLLLGRGEAASLLSFKNLTQQLHFLFLNKGVLVL